VRRQRVTDSAKCNFLIGFVVIANMINIRSPGLNYFASLIAQSLMARSTESGNARDKSSDSRVKDKSSRDRLVNPPVA
jgi:hypothetical protein